MKKVDIGFLLDKCQQFSFLYILPNLRLQFFSVTKPTMSKKRSVPTKGPLDAPKRPRKMLTIAEKVKLLDMLKEDKSYAAVGRHYGINESSVRYIKKEENNVRTTAAISFNKDAKRVVTVRNKAIVRMESALALWINDCRKRALRWIPTLSAQKLKNFMKLLLTMMSLITAKGRGMRIPGHQQVLFTPSQAHLMPAKAGLRNFRNALDLKMFLCTERSRLRIQLAQRNT